VLALLLVAAVPASAKFTRGPAGEAFYTPPSPLPSGKHGSLIWARKLTGEPALTAAARNMLVLYRSVGSDGKPIAVSGTVSLPKGKVPKRGWPVITYDHGTTGIADQCAPSKDATDNPAHAYIAYAYPLLNRWLKAGYAVVRTDYQGLGTPGTHEYLVGISEGRSTLDIVRAARGVDSRVSKRFAVSGHSQGGHAALWGAALASKYTPDLKLRATVAFAPASHISDQLSAIEALSSPTPLTGLISIITRGLDSSAPSLDLSSKLGTRAAELYPETLTKCLLELSLSDSFGGVAPADLFRDDADISAVGPALDANDPENLTIRSPLAIEQGGADTTVIPGLTDALVKKLRGRGSKIDYKTYKNVSHGGVVDAAAVHATRYLKKHLR
jgi:dienelactone hydrolase